MKNSLILITKSKLTWALIALFAILSVWWVYISLLPFEETEGRRQIWAASYQIIAFLGGIIGIYISKSWGGGKSVLGRAILAFSLGLFLQSFGQSFYSYYIFFLKIEVPYPSIGDIGFFGSIPAYIYALYLLGKASGAHLSFKSSINIVKSILIPLVLLLLSYFVFLRGYEVDLSSPLKVFLDFGYPFGQAIYVSIAILTWLLSRSILGGLMRGPILFLVFALIFQYISDYTFLYQASRGLWSVGGINDYLYCISYLLMTLGLIYTGQVFHKLKES